MEEVIQNDADTVPKITTVLEYGRSRLVADKEEGTEIHERIGTLVDLATTSRWGVLRERK